MKSTHLSLAPRVSEQTYAMSESGTYVFEVPKIATKQQIKSAVEDQFNVTVKSVNTTVIKGKAKASNRRARPAIYGKRRSIKKAYVKLQPGDKITMFEEGL